MTEPEVAIDHDFAELQRRLAEAQSEAVLGDTPKDAANPTASSGGQATATGTTPTPKV